MRDVRKSLAGGRVGSGCRNEPADDCEMVEYVDVVVAAAYDVESIERPGLSCDDASLRLVSDRFLRE